MTYLLEAFNLIKEKNATPTHITLTNADGNAELYEVCIIRPSAPMMFNQ